LDEHPLCKHCQDKDMIVAATIVDHIIPHRGDQSRFWDQDNWQPLCKSCHDIKTATVTANCRPRFYPTTKRVGWF
jgi:5-methylcytosine-specific restriction protein A